MIKSTFLFFSLTMFIFIVSFSQTKEQWKKCGWTVEMEFTHHKRIFVQGYRCTPFPNDDILEAQRERGFQTLLIVTTVTNVLQNDLPYRHMFNLKFHNTTFTLIMCDTFLFSIQWRLFPVSLTSQHTKEWIRTCSLENTPLG